MVRVDEELYEQLRGYEAELGVPVARAVNEAVRTFVECVVPPRVEFMREQRQRQRQRQRVQQGQQPQQTQQAG